MQKLNSSGKGENESTDRDLWSVFRIMSEFVDGFDTLRDLHPALSIFGSSALP